MPAKPSEKAGLLVRGEPLDTDYLHTQSHLLLFVKGKRPQQVVRALVEEGVEPDLAREVVMYQVQQFNEQRKRQGRKDALQGLLWFGGGAVLTYLDVGFIFWGAVVYGGWGVISGLSKLV